MARTIKTEALVLRKYSLPNEDRIITLFTKDRGKMSVVAKGIKKITSRRLPHMETANLVRATLSQTRDRFYLQDSTLLSGFTALKTASRKIDLMYFYFFILEYILPPEQPESHIYTSTLHFMVQLSEAESADTFPILSYLNNLLKMLGYSNADMTFESLCRAVEGIIHKKLPEISI